MAGVMLDADHQTRQCQKLLASVVANAVRDLTTVGYQREYRTPRPGSPATKQRKPMSSNAFTAARFLFDEEMASLEAYFDWLDIDAKSFRDRLIAAMYDSSAHRVAGWEPEQRRAMRINFEIWRKVRHGDTTDLEGDDDE